jgi:hypothetical protein
MHGALQIVGHKAGTPPETFRVAIDATDEGKTSLILNAEQIPGLAALPRDANIVPAEAGTPRRLTARPWIHAQLPK